MKNKLAIYIHYPFCLSKCPYCDFNSHVEANVQDKIWQQAYIDNIEHFQSDITGKTITSIYFGGGTPSLMPATTVDAIIDRLSQIGNFAPNIEITLEANPTSFETQKFQDFKRAGVNRVSIGVQSLQDKYLKFLGRQHSVTSAMNAVQQAANIFDNFSFDLIYALPKQSLTEWQQDLETALKLANGHLSLYQLTIEKGTKFYSDYRDNKFQLPNTELAADFYNLTHDLTNNAGYHAYEVSNYAIIDKESQHNLTYWQMDEYLGLGAGAHSRIRDKNGNMQAIVMLHHPNSWLSAIKTGKNGIQNQQILINKDIAIEMLIMGLRITAGINKQDFLRKTTFAIDNIINMDNAHTMQKYDLLIINQTHIRLTHAGRLILDSIIKKILD